MIFFYIQELKNTFMAFLEAFEKSFAMIVKNIKVVLPVTLNWLVTSFFILYVLFFWKFFDKHIGLIERMKLALNYPESFQLYSMNEWLYVMGFLLGLFVISLIYLSLNVFLDLFYTFCMKHYYFRKRVDFNQSIDASLRHFGKLFYTWLLAFMAILLAIATSMLLAFIPFIGFFVFLALIFLVLFFTLLFIILPPIVVFEKREGMEALKGGCDFVKKNFLSLLGILIIIGLLHIVAFSLSHIPFFGFFVYLFANAFLVGWSKSLPAAFYLEVT